MANRFEDDNRRQRNKTRSEISSPHPPPPTDPSECLYDASPITQPPGYSYSIATLSVKNTSNRKIIAALEWNGSVRVENVVVYANSTTNTKKTLNLELGEKLEMTVLEANWGKKD